MKEPREDTRRWAEVFKLGRARGLYALEPRPLASEYPLDTLHQEYVNGYEAGLRKRAADGRAKQLEQAWTVTKDTDSN